MTMTLPSEVELLRHIMLTVDAAWANGLSRTEIERWLSNFTGDILPIPDERRIALFLLANFVYYNEHEVRHLTRTVFGEYLHVLLKEPEYQGNSDLGNVLNRVIQESCFCPFGKPGESGAFVLYFFRQDNNLGTRHMADALRPPAYARNVVLIDDVTLTSDQAISYLTGMDTRRRTLLLTFIASPEAIKILNDRGVKVISAIILDERSRCFSQQATLYREFRDSFDDCLKFAEHYGDKSMTNQASKVEPLGYNNGQFTFGFFYNTPDNSLPIFWADNTGWKPIMRRYDKYKEVPNHEFPRFV